MDEWVSEWVSESMGGVIVLEGWWDKEGINITNRVLTKLNTEETNAHVTHIPFTEDETRYLII